MRCCARSPRQQARRCWSPGPRPFRASPSSAPAWPACRWHGCSTESTTSRCIEAGASIGGNVQSVEVDLDGHQFVVDIGAQYFHPGPYPVYTALLESLGLYPPEAAPGGSHAFPASITQFAQRRSDALIRLAGAARSSLADRRPLEPRRPVGVRHLLCGRASAGAGGRQLGADARRVAAHAGTVAGPMGRDAASVGGVVVFGQHRTGERAVGPRGDDLRGESTAAQPARSASLLRADPRDGRSAEASPRSVLDGPGPDERRRVAGLAGSGGWVRARLRRRHRRHGRRSGLRLVGPGHAAPAFGPARGGAAGGRAPGNRVPRRAAGAPHRSAVCAVTAAVLVVLQLQRPGRALRGIDVARDRPCGGASRDGRKVVEKLDDPPGAATGADAPRSHLQAHAAHGGDARGAGRPPPAAGTRRNLVRGRLHPSIRRAGDRAAVSVGRGAGARHLRPLASGPWRGTRKSRSKSKSGRP